LGARGPKPKAPGLELLQGTPGKRGKRSRVAARVSRPACPAWLTREAKAEWGRVTDELEEMGILCKVDRGLIATYCEAWAEFREADQMVRKEGKVKVTTNGNLIQNPWLGIKNKAAERMLKLSNQFGFSPSARTGLDANTGTEEVDPFEEFIGRKKA
jgi:P27 family predicted phage terminase small subunit